jgi:hypothetical protein
MTGILSVDLEAHLKALQLELAQTRAERDEARGEIAALERVAEERRTRGKRAEAERDQLHGQVDILEKRLDEARAQSGRIFDVLTKKEAQVAEVKRVLGMAGVWKVGCGCFERFGLIGAALGAPAPRNQSEPDVIAELGKLLLEANLKPYFHRLGCDMKLPCECSKAAAPRAETAKPSALAFIGPCVHGFDPYDRCDDCQMLTQEEAQRLAEPLAPLPPEILADALQDRIHPTSGRLLASKPIMPPAAEWQQRAEKAEAEVAVLQEEIASKNKYLPGLLSEGKKIEQERAEKAEAQLAACVDNGNEVKRLPDGRYSVNNVRALAAEAQCAAMRAALKEADGSHLHADDCDRVECDCGRDEAKARRIEAALASDAGRGYLAPADVEKLLDLCDEAKSGELGGTLALLEEDPSAFDGWLKRFDEALDLLEAKRDARGTR